MIFDGDPEPPFIPYHISPWFLPSMVVLGIIVVAVIIAMILPIMAELEEAESTRFDIFKLRR